MEDSDQEPSAGMTTASTASSVSTIDQAVVTQADLLKRLIIDHQEKVRHHFDSLESSVKQIYKSAQDRLIFCRVQVESAYEELLESLQQQHVTTTSPEGDLGQRGEQLLQRQENGAMNCDTNSNNNADNSSVSSGFTNLTSGVS